MPQVAALTDAKQAEQAIVYKAYEYAKISDMGLIDLLIFSVGAAHGRERLWAIGEAQDRGHGPLLQFNQLNPPPKFPPTGSFYGCASGGLYINLSSG